MNSFSVKDLSTTNNQTRCVTAKKERWSASPVHLRIAGSHVELHGMNWSQCAGWKGRRRAGVFFREHPLPSSPCSTETQLHAPAFAFLYRRRGPEWKPRPLGQNIHEWQCGNKIGDADGTAANQQPCHDDDSGTKASRHWMLHTHKCVVHFPFKINQ